MQWSHHEYISDIALVSTIFSESFTSWSVCSEATTEERPLSARGSTPDSYKQALPRGKEVACMSPVANNHDHCLLLQCTEPRI